MIANTVLWLAGRELKALSLPNQRGEEAKAVSQEILQIFYSGAECSLKQLSFEAVHAREKKIGWHRRFFFWEGYAFGLAGKAALNLSRPNPDSLRLIPHYRSMHFTGYGFWNGLMGNMPMLGLSESDTDWAEVDDSDRLGPLFWGGASFGEVVFGGKLSRKSLSRAEKKAGELGRLGALHGIGRALWWMYMDNPEGFEASLTLEGEELRAVMEGVGLAIAFVNILNPPKIASLIEQFDPSVRRSLEGGVGVTMQAIVEEHPEHAKRMADIDVPILRRAYTLAARISEEVPANSSWYGECVRRIRAAMDGVET